NHGVVRVGYGHRLREPEHGNQCGLGVELRGDWHACFGVTIGPDVPLPVRGDELEWARERRGSKFHATGLAAARRRAAVAQFLLRSGLAELGRIPAAAGMGYRGA